MTDPLFARFGRAYRAGDVLCREGEAGDVMFVIQAGSVRISKQVGGEDKPLAVLGPGEFVGEMAILNNKPRTATAVAVDEVRCLVIDAKTLETMVSRNAEIAIRLVKKLAKRLDSANTLIEILMHRDPKARVMLALSRYAEAFGERIEGGIRVRMSAPELAREVGIDEAVASEVLARLRRLRLVTEEPSALIVTDIGRLQDFIEFLEMPQRFSGES